jgi:CheY-like chemotaxis protein
MESKSNILVVDDNPDKLSLIEAALSLAGYHVTTATDGDEALAAIESYQPDLVITDVMMPRMNGYELAQRIRANPVTKFIPVIMQTAAGRRVKIFGGPTKSALWATSLIPPISICCWPDQNAARVQSLSGRLRRSCFYGPPDRSGKPQKIRTAA